MADHRVEARKLVEESLNRLATELRDGKTEGLKNCLSTMSQFPHRSWRNALRIWQQRPTATRVEGIQTWSKLGRTIKEGEKPIMILQPDPPQTPRDLGQAATKKGGWGRILCGTATEPGSMPQGLQ